MSEYRIECWSICLDYADIYQAPELYKKYLQGNVYDNERFNEGTFIHTSSIQDIDLDNGIIKTKNSTYKLGKIDSEYLEYCEQNNVNDLDKLRKFI